MRVAIVVGTRPEIIKMSPIVRECQRRGVDVLLIDTKQHYSSNMSDSFFEELSLPEPDYTLDTKAASHGQQISSMLVQFEDILARNPCDIVLVQGDTNSVFAGAFMAGRQNIAVGHVEAGLRSHDRTMPEEANRVMVDHIADYLFATSDETLENLKTEGLPHERIWNTGNTVVDATLAKVADMQANPPQLPEGLPDEYILVTLHRPANVDNTAALTEILRGIQTVSKILNLPVVFSVHPRTRKNIAAAGITLPDNFTLIDPQGYAAFLYLQAHAALIMTDSGGVQEEACILHVPCVTLRENTERPETITVGANMLGGVRTDSIIDAARQMFNTDRRWDIPYGDGKASERIVDIVLQQAAAA